MIVDSMTAQEIHDELFADFRSILPTVEYRKEKFRSACLKARLYPFRQVYECKSLVRRNRFFVIFTAVRRGQYKEPFQGYYCVYDRPEGLYCAVLHPSGNLREPNLTCIYPPHFFSRYRERLGISGTISSIDLIHHFIKHQWAITVMMFREVDNEALVKEVGEEGMPKEGGVAPYKGHID